MFKVFFVTPLIYVTQLVSNKEIQKKNHQSNKLESTTIYITTAAAHHPLMC